MASDQVISGVVFDVFENIAQFMKRLLTKGRER